MANCQPLDCQSTIINMNDKLVPNLQDVRGWSIWINQQHTSWHRSYGRQCDDTRWSTYKLYENMISKSITHSFRRNAIWSADQGYWNTMTSTIPTTCQRSTKIVQLMMNILVRVVNWQSQIPISSVTRTWCRAPTHPQATTTQYQVFYLRDMSIPPVNKLITNIP